MHLISRAITKTIRVELYKQKVEILENNKVIETKTVKPYFEGQFDLIYNHYKQIYINYGI